MKRTRPPEKAQSAEGYFSSNTKDLIQTYSSDLIRQNTRKTQNPGGYATRNTHGHGTPKQDSDELGFC